MSRGSNPRHAQITGDLGFAVQFNAKSTTTSNHPSPFQALDGRTCHLPLQNSQLSTDMTDDRVQTLLTTWRDNRHNIYHSCKANEQASQEALKVQNL